VGVKLAPPAPDRQHALRGGGGLAWAQKYLGGGILACAREYLGAGILACARNTSGGDSCMCRGIRGGTLVWLYHASRGRSGVAGSWSRLASSSATPRVLGQTSGQVPAEQTRHLSPVTHETWHVSRGRTWDINCVDSGKSPTRDPEPRPLRPHASLGTEAAATGINDGASDIVRCLLCECV
jgi:hypothetical protein